jgi:ABC-type lipoprotein release transport system permease subunit
MSAGERHSTNFASFTVAGTASHELVVVRRPGTASIASLTDRLRTVDLQAFVVDPLLLVAIAVLAAWLPARRSATVAPSECLRSD